MSIRHSNPGKPAAPEIMPRRSFTDGMVSGVFWLTVQRWLARITGLVTIAILTRLLTPAEFGTVAAAMTLLPFFYLLADLGFAAFIVQAEQLGRRTLSTAWWFAAGAGIALWGVFFLAAPLMAVVFNAPGVTEVLRVLSLCVLLTAFSSVPVALLRRQMRFPLIALQSGIAAVVAQVVAIVLAFSGAGVWALVAQTLTALAITGALSWVSARWMPRFEFSARDFREMSRFGVSVLGTEFVAAVRVWAEAAIITGFLGVTALGYVNIAQRLVAIVQDLTASAITPVSTVAFARIRNDAPRLAAAYVRALRTTYAGVAPPLTLLIVAAPLIVPIAFGDGWEPSFALTQIYALAGTMTIASSLDHGFFYGLGRPARWFVFGLGLDILTVTVTLVAVQFGLIAVAWGFVAVALAGNIGRWFLVAHALGTPRRRIARPFLFLAAGLAAATGVGFPLAWATQALPPPVSVVLLGVAVVGAYLLVMALLAPEVLRDVAAIVSTRMPRRGTRGGMPT
ncbi:lipopolysaccharide biosynthesis protein [Microbacterium aurum]